MTSADRHPVAGADAVRLDPGVLKIAGVVVLGTVMAVLDTTVVNVALQALSMEFRTSLDTIQWVVTGYLLAQSAMVPVTGWAADRFGTRRLYLVCVGMFLVGSVLAGMAWNVGTLIVFRVVQGLGGGMLMPAGMTILTRAAGRERIARVMSVLGVPMLLGPISGPVLGGWLVDSAGWRWIFYVNVPLGLLTIWAAWKILPEDRAEPASRFDFLGMLMLSPGLASLLFGASMLPGARGVTDVTVWLPALLGVALIALFTARAGRIEHPLIDPRLFRDRTFSVSVLALALYSVSYSGVMVLLPAYFLLVRGEPALQVGLLLVPQGLGSMTTIALTGRLAERVGSGTVVLCGLAATVAGFVPFTVVGPATPDGLLLGALFVIGLGVGASVMPLMTVALQSLTARQVARGSTATNILQQAFGATGSAVLSIILAALLAGKFGVPTDRGQVAATVAVRSPSGHAVAAGMASDAFASTFGWAALLLVLCLVPALFLARRPPRSADPMTNSQVALLLFDLALILVLARLFGVAARRLRQDVVIGEIVAGILLGPSLFGGYLPDHLFPAAIRPPLTALANLGIALFMFMVGLGVDHGLPRGVRTKAVAVAGGATAVPFALGIAVAVWLVPRTHPTNRLGFILFVGLSMAVTAFPVLARILEDRGLSRTALGRLSLSAAAIGDTLAWALLAVVLSIAGLHGTPVWRVLSAVPFIIVVLVAGRPLLARLMGPVRTGPDGAGVARALAVVVAALLGTGAFLEWSGLDYMFGAFLVGVVVPRGENNRTAAMLRDRIEQVSVMVLMPVFFVIAGLSVDLGTLGAGGIGALALILLGAVGGKFAGAFGGSRLAGVDTRQAIGLATLMNTRGLTEMVFLATGVRVGVLDHRTYSMMVIMALVTTMMTGPLINVVLRRGQRPVRADAVPMSCDRCAVLGERCRAHSG